jgi:hypothetical protein
MAAVPSKQSESKPSYQCGRDAFEITEFLDNKLPPSEGVWRRRRAFHQGFDGALNCRKPVCKSVPVLFQKRKPFKPVGIYAPVEKFSYGRVQNESVRLGKGWKDANGSSTRAASEPPHENAQDSTLRAGEITRIVAQRLQCFLSTAMRTRGGWFNFLVKTLVHVLIGTYCNRVDNLHGKELIPVQQFCSPSVASRRPVRRTQTRLHPTMRRRTHYGGWREQS